MTAVRRACLYLVRTGGKTVGLLAFLLVMATLALTCLAIGSAVDTADGNIRRGLQGSFTVNARQLAGGITPDALDRILAVDGLSGRYNLRSTAYANYCDADGNPLAVSTEGAAAPAGYEQAGKVVANTSSQEDGYFTAAGFELVEGVPIGPGDEGAALIHEDFAARNGLAVGDTLLLEGVNGPGATAEVTVVGVFATPQEQADASVAPSCDLYENIVFTDVATASQLLYGADAPIGAEYGDFYVDDPAELDRIVGEVRNIGGVDWDACTISLHDADYQHVRASLEGLRGVVAVALAAVAGISLAVLALFLTLRLRGRVRETGVYLALGIPKGTVLAQYLLEVLMVAAVALALAYGASAAVTGQVGSRLFAQAGAGAYEAVDLTDGAAGDEDGAGAENENALADLGLSTVEVAVSPRDFATVCALGIAVCLASTALAAGPVLRMRPKDILEHFD